MQAICKDITCSHFPTSQAISYYILFSATHTRKSGLPALWVAVLGYAHPLLPRFLVLQKQNSLRTFFSDLQTNLLTREAS